MSPVSGSSPAQIHRHRLLSVAAGVLLAPAILLAPQVLAAQQVKPGLEHEDTYRWNSIGAARSRRMATGSPMSSRPGTATPRS